MHGNPRKRPGSAKAFAKLISGEISTDLASRAVSPLERRGAQSAEQSLWYVQIEQPDGRIEKFSARSDVLLGLLAKKNIPSHALVSKHRDGPFDLIANVNINEAPLDAPKSPNASGDEEYTDDGFKDLDAEFNNSTVPCRILILIRTISQPRLIRASSIDCRSAESTNRIPS